ncbi:hypothetical protein F5Y13DRAFT_191697 [Hypoxylon sp. FL1857]|nr:hypothetical protein F5Y13DRAFT_191697 [Hypoxylon sp. FL1857]
MTSSTGTINAVDSVERLFQDLVLEHPFFDDRAGYRPDTDRKYRQALQRFLDQTADTTETNPDIPLLRDVASQVLTLHEGLRVPFIEGLADLSLGSPVAHWGRRQGDFLACSRWIMQGRKEDRYPERLLPEGVTNRRAVPQGLRQDFDNMPNKLTMLSKCSRCRDKEVTLVCGGCHVQYDDKHYTISRGYCSRRCQAEDWPHHRETCKAILQLDRTVTIMQTVLILTEDEASCFSPIMVHERNNVTIIREESPLLEAMQGKFFIHRFPRNRLSGKRQVMMASSNQFARDIVSQIQPLKVWLWSDLLCKEILEVTILVKNVDHPILRSTPDGKKKSTMLEPHTVFRIVLHNGEEYAVDLAGGRYGWEEAIMRWDDYYIRRVWRIISEVPSRNRPPDYTTLPPLNTIPVAVSELHGIIIKWMVSRLRPLSSINSTPAGILETLATRNNRWWHETMDAVKDFLRRECSTIVWVLTGLSKSGWMYADANSEPRITLNAADYEKLRDVWVPRDEALTFDTTDTERLQRIWSQRLTIHGIQFKNPAPTNQEMINGVAVLADPEPDTPDALEDTDDSPDTWGSWDTQDREAMEDMELNGDSD